MKVLVAQISDIHLRFSTDVALTRGQKIGEAIRGRTDGASACVLAITGDVGTGPGGTVR